MKLFGILNVNKPPGCTSRSVVDRVERITRPIRAGHAGTLDPLATGVLVICVGGATRLIDRIQRMSKRYRATFLLGKRSDTDDVEGVVTSAVDVPHPSREELDRVLPKFLGEILQIPPAYSALKVAGRRAYKLARRNESFDLAPRNVSIHELAVVRYEYPELELDIECGSGTYVRALGRDLASALGTCAVMSALERTAIGGFRIDDALHVDALKPESLLQQLQPATAAVPDLPRVQLTEAELVEIRNGRPIDEPQGAFDNGMSGPHGTWPETEPREDRGTASAPEWAATDEHRRLVAILRRKEPGKLWPIRNFM